MPVVDFSSDQAVFEERLFCQSMEVNQANILTLQLRTYTILSYFPKHQGQKLSEINLSCVMQRQVLGTLLLSSSIGMTPTINYNLWRQPTTILKSGSQQKKAWMG